MNDLLDDKRTSNRTRRSQDRTLTHAQQTKHTCKLLTSNRHIGWLVGCLTARQDRKVNLCQLRGRAQSAKYGQRDTMHVTSRYTITM